MNTSGEVRPFGFWTATAMVVGGMVGAGIFVLPSQLAPYGWTGMAAWGVGGLGAIAIAYILATVAEARPQEPGLIAVIGEVLGPVAGVLVGWGAWVSYWCANAYIALVSARYASQFVPAIGSSPLRQALTASLIVVVLTVLNLSSLRRSGRFQVLTSALKVIPLVAVLLIGAGLLVDGGTAYSAVPHAPFAGADLFSATSLALVAIIGFESASIAAQRVKNPEKNIPLATMAGVIAVCLLYVGVCSAIVFSMPQDVLVASNAPVALFVARFWGDWAGLAIAGFAVISTVGCLNVWIMLQSEVPLGLIRAGLLPEWLGRTNAKDIAVAPLVIASALTVALLLLGSWNSGAALMDFMLRLTAASGIYVYGFAAVTALVLRRRIFVALFSLGFVIAAMVGAGFHAVLLATVLMLAALPFYWLTLRTTPAQQPAE